MTTPQIGSALTVIVPVTAGRETALATLLTDIGEHIVGNPWIPFQQLTRVHFMRWVLLPPNPSVPTQPVQLAFECNYDGSGDELLEELLTCAPTGVHAIYQHCTGYPASEPPASREQRARIAEYLLTRQLPYAAFYVGTPNLTVQQIRGEQAIRALVTRQLDSMSPVRRAQTDPRELCRELLAQVMADPQLARVLASSDDKRKVRPLRIAGGVLALIAATPALLLGLLGIRAKELVDKQSGALAVPDETRELMAREDLQLQNQLTHLVPLKPGTLRQLSARVVLGVIDFLAHELYTTGQLGGISSIHFARWVLIDEGKRLLFFSNYDGSWEAYLGDFIDKAATGLTSVWSNTEQFPKSLFLAFKGATDEERFKAWTREHQVNTQLWYSAYPDLTVRNILNNRSLCAQLRRGIVSEHDARAWLRLL